MCCERYELHLYTIFGLIAACKRLRGCRLWEEKVCVFCGRYLSLMVETGELTVRILSTTGVTRDVGGLIFFLRLWVRIPPRGARMFVAVLFSWSGEGSR